MAGPIARAADERVARVESLQHTGAGRALRTAGAVLARGLAPTRCATLLAGAAQGRTAPRPDAKTGSRAHARAGWRPLLGGELRSRASASQAPGKSCQPGPERRCPFGSSAGAATGSYLAISTPPLGP